MTAKYWHVYGRALRRKDVPYVAAAKASDENKLVWHFWIVDNSIVAPTRPEIQAGFKVLPGKPPHRHLASFDRPPTPADLAPLVPDIFAPSHVFGPRRPAKAVAA